MLTQPLSAKRASFAASMAGVSLYVRPRPAVPRSGCMRPGSARSPASVRTWSVMNSGPVAQLSPTAEQIEVRDGDVERFDVLAREHRAHRLDRCLARHRHARVPSSAIGAIDADERRLDVARVLRGLDEQEVRRRPR